MGFLRALTDSNYRSGLDGEWAPGLELEDWSNLAENVRDEPCRLNHRRRSPVRLGRLGLPGIRETGEWGERFCVMDHPLWRIDRTATTVEPFTSAIRHVGGRPLHYVDVFDAGRRPVSALETARSRGLG